MSSEGKKEFKVNNYITLKLEDDKTFIYIMGERFNQCKYLLLNISVGEITSLDEIESIDEAAEKLDDSLETLEHASAKIQIPPKVEFWGHCSNLQVWAENDYDSRLLHSNLAFPLLKELTDRGDPQAKRVFKDEIAKRIQSKYLPVVQFLKEANFFYYLNEEEKETAFSDYDKVIVNGKAITVVGFELNLPYKNVNDISEIIGLEKCIYLKELDLSNNKIKKINGLENLTELVKLNLCDNQIQKIEGLITLTKLKALFLDRNQINKIQGFEILVNLQELSISKNRIDKIEEFNNLANLKSLVLSNNKISKIEGLEKLANLEELYLVENSIKKIEGLNRNILLQKIFLSNNYINKIEGFDNLLNLKFLSLEKNIISKIENLDQVKQLEGLKLGGNKIQKIEKLENLTNLQKLNLSHNQIATIEGLKNLSILKGLNLNSNPIASIKGLENLEKLEVFYLKDTKIPLEFIKELGGYSPSYKVNYPKNFVEYCQQIKN